MFVRRLLHPLKIQPGILLGTDLNNAVGDERWPGEHALPPPSPPLSPVPLPQLPAEIQNLKAARCRGRRETAGRAGKSEEGARAISRFRDFAMVPPWGIKVIKRLSNLDPPQDIPRVVDLPLSRGDSRFNSKTRR